MSIRLPVQLGSDNYFETNDYRTIFDPRNHNLWSHVRPTFERFIDIIKALYSRHNLSDWDNFGKYVLTTRENETAYKEFYNDLLTLIPDENLWLFAYSHGVSWSSGSGWKLYVPHFINYNEPDYISFGNEPTTRRGTPAALATLWNAEADEANRFVAQHGSKTVQYNDTPSLPFMFSGSFMQMCCNLRYMRASGVNHNYNAITAAEAHTFLASPAASEASLIIEINQFTGEYTCKLAIPITYTNRQQLYQVFEYRTDVTSMLPGKRKLPTEGTPVHIGVELELTTDYCINDLIDACKEPFFIAKQDSSITGQKLNKMELVTVPGSFKYLKKQYAHWFNNLNYSKFDCTTETSNGMHVHVDRQAFDDDYHIRNFCWFINNPANTPFIVAMSDRGSLQAMQTYTPFFPFPHGYTRTQAFKTCHRLIGRQRGATNLKGGWDHAKTIEVRIFRGIVSYAAIIKNLEFVESLYHFTQSLRSYRNMSLESYFKWLMETPSNRYTVLKKFIDQLDMSKFLLAASVKDVIFNETDPDKIVALLSKSNLRITNDLVSFLNKGLKRTYVLDKSTNQIQVIKHNIFKLASMDIELAKRIGNALRRAS